MNPHALAYGLLALLALTDPGASRTQVAVGDLSALLAILALWAGDSRGQDTAALSRIVPSNRRRADARRAVDANGGLCGGAS